MHPNLETELNLPEDVKAVKEGDDVGDIIKFFRRIDDKYIRPIFVYKYEKRKKNMFKMEVEDLLKDMQNFELMMDENDSDDMNQTINKIERNSFAGSYYAGMVRAKSLAGREKSIRIENSIKQEVGDQKDYTIKPTTAGLFEYGKQVSFMVRSEDGEKLGLIEEDDEKSSNRLESINMEEERNGIF